MHRFLLNTGFQCNVIIYSSDADGVDVTKVASIEFIEAENLVKSDTEQANESGENDADADDDSIGDDNKQSKQNLSSADESASTNLDASSIAKGEDFVNTMGVRFTPQAENGASLFYQQNYLCVNLTKFICMLLLVFLTFISFTV